MRSVLQKENGNALIYVLIAVGLLAALNFVFIQQNDTAEANILTRDKAELFATQIIDYSAQAKAAIDRMEFAGAAYDDIDYTLPGEAGYGTNAIYQLYHPSGGGLVPFKMPEELMQDDGGTPGPGIYIGRFNNVEWSDSTDQDIIFTAYQIDETVCGLINSKINNDQTIIQTAQSIPTKLIDTKFHGSGNTNFEIGDCTASACEDQIDLCIQTTGNVQNSYYSLLVAR